MVSVGRPAAVGPLLRPQVRPSCWAWHGQHPVCGQFRGGSLVLGRAERLASDGFLLLVLLLLLQEGRRADALLLLVLLRLVTLRDLRWKRKKGNRLAEGEGSALLIVRVEIKKGMNQTSG